MPRRAHVIATDRVIDAHPDDVWAIVVDLPRYPEWNPQIVGWEGDVQEGARVRERLRTSSGREMSFRPRLLRIDPPRELVQEGVWLAGPLFRAEHRFVLEPLGHTTRAVKVERISGLLVPLLRRRLEREARRTFPAVLAALERRVQSALS